MQVGLQYEVGPGRLSLSVLHLLPRSFPASADTDLYIKLTLHEGGRVIKVGSATVQCLQSSRTLFSSTYLAWILFQPHS